MRTQIEITAIAIGLIAVLAAALTAVPVHAAPGIAGGKSYKALPAHPGSAAKGFGYHDRQARGTKAVYKPGARRGRIVVGKPRIVGPKIQPVQPIHKVSGPRKPPRAYYGPPPKRIVLVPERRRYRNVWVVRPHGHRYYGYGYYRDDRGAYPWLAFTAINVRLVDAMSEQQQRAYEDAQVRATSAPIGETIRWNDDDASGTVTATREGSSSLDRYCREFQQTVTIGGETEQAYGTACRQPDGAWEIIP